MRPLTLSPGWPLPLPDCHPAALPYPVDSHDFSCVSATVEYCSACALSLLPLLPRLLMLMRAGALGGKVIAGVRERVPDIVRGFWPGFWQEGTSSSSPKPRHSNKCVSAIGEWHLLGAFSGNVGETHFVKCIIQQKCFSIRMPCLDPLELIDLSFGSCRLSLFYFLSIFCGVFFVWIRGIMVGRGILLIKYVFKGFFEQHLFYL